MKNFTKPIGIIALAAVIGFAVTACGDGGGNAGGNGGSDITPPPPQPIVLTVANAGQWNNAVAAIKNTIGSGSNQRDFVINVTNDFELEVAGSDGYTFGGFTSHITVTINGNHTISLRSGTTGSLLSISRYHSVTINDIDLKGHSDNDSSLVIVDGGNFIMNGSASVHGNTNNSGFGGGGVYVRPSRVFGGGVAYVRGTFTMNDSASVYGNTYNGNSGGGGVYNDSGTFTMNGNASVYGNTYNGTYTEGGGGVYNDGGTLPFIFTMNGGTVYGDVGAPNGNAATSGGAALYVSGSGTARYGDGFDIGGTASTPGSVNTTITGRK